jgi:hypothetical protein
VGARLVLGSADVQRGHVPLELELLDRRERVVGRSRPPRRRVEHVVHVGDVPAHLRFHPEEAQRAAERVAHANAGRVPEMRNVVRGNAARVHAGPVQQFHPLARDLPPAGRGCGAFR